MLEGGPILDLSKKFIPLAKFSVIPVVLPRSKMFDNGQSQNSWYHFFAFTKHFLQWKKPKFHNNPFEFNNFFKKNCQLSEKIWTSGLKIIFWYTPYATPKRPETEIFATPLEHFAILSAAPTWAFPACSLTYHNDRNSYQVKLSQIIFYVKLYTS